MISDEEKTKYFKNLLLNTAVQMSLFSRSDTEKALNFF